MFPICARLKRQNSGTPQGYCIWASMRARSVHSLSPLAPEIGFTRFQAPLLVGRSRKHPTSTERGGVRGDSQFAPRWRVRSEPSSISLIASSSRLAESPPHPTSLRQSSAPAPSVQTRTRRPLAFGCDLSPQAGRGEPWQGPAKCDSPGEHPSSRGLSSSRQSFLAKRMDCTKVGCFRLWLC
jgi:hypothetical protein